MAVLQHQVEAGQRPRLLRVTESPQTRYAKNGDLHIANQVAGDGPMDLMLISEWHLPLNACWSPPTPGRSRRVALFSVTR